MADRKSTSTIFKDSDGNVVSPPPDYDPNIGPTAEEVTASKVKKAAPKIERKTSSKEEEK